MRFGPIFDLFLVLKRPLLKAFWDFPWPITRNHSLTMPKETCLSIPSGLGTTAVWGLEYTTDLDAIKSVCGCDVAWRRHAVYRPKAILSPELTASSAACLGKVTQSPHLSEHPKWSRKNLEKHNFFRLGDPGGRAVRPNCLWAVPPSSCTKFPLVRGCRGLAG